MLNDQRTREEWRRLQSGEVNKSCCHGSNHNGLLRVLILAVSENRHTMCACVTAELFFGSYLLSTVAPAITSKPNAYSKLQIAHSKLKSLTANSRVCLFVEGRGYFFECRGYIVEDPYFTKGKPILIIKLS